MQTLPSVLIRFLWMMRNVLKRMKNEFSNFYFYELASMKIHQKLGGFEYKNDHKSKTKIAKIWNSIISFSWFCNFHVNLNTFEKKIGKKIEFFEENLFFRKTIFLVGWFSPSQKASRGWIFFFGLVDPSWNRLTSTAYFAIVSSVFQSLHQNKFFFFFKVVKFTCKMRNLLNLS